MARSGIMLYFDPWSSLAEQGDEILGRFLRAALDYVETGEVPEMQGMEKTVWASIRNALDRDGERYELAKMKKRYAVWCREERAHGRTPVSFEDWQLMNEEETDAASCDNTRYQNDPYSSSDSITASDSNAASKTNSFSLSSPDARAGAASDPAAPAKKYLYSPLGEDIDLNEYARRRRAELGMTGTPPAR